MGALRKPHENASIRTGSPATVVRTSNIPNWALLPLRHEQMAGHRHFLVGRPAGPALERRCPDCCHAAARALRP